MNDSTLTQLKIIVERAVRPVRAGAARKRRMREELLAHVMDAFAEESAKVGDEHAALERTTQRFGNAAELTSQLQATVPAGDAIEQWLAGGPDESTLRFAVRLAVITTALGAIVFGAILLTTGPVSVWPTESLVLSCLAILTLPTYLVGVTFVAEWARPVLCDPERRSRGMAALLAVGWILFTVVLFESLPILFVLGIANFDYWNVLWLTLWVAASAPVPPLALAQSTNARIRYQQEWASLNIDRGK
jgi:hypothetical protein